MGVQNFDRALDQLEGEGLEIPVTTAHTPESNGLAERAHQTLIALARTCLQESRLPVQYWSYAVQHVANCTDMVPGKKGKAPYEVLFGRPSPSIRQIRLFGCHMLCRPSGKKIDTFKPRAINGLNLYHEGGGVYRVLTVDNIRRTKHRKALEDKFPGLKIFRSPALDNSSETDPEMDFDIVVIGEPSSSLANVDPSDKADEENDQADETNIDAREERL